MMPQSDDEIREPLPNPTEGTLPAPRTFEAYDGDTLIAYGDASDGSIRYLHPLGAARVVEVLHGYGLSLLNSPVPPADGVGFVLREGERYSGAV